MNIKKVFIAHSWTDVGVNIQTKAVAKKLSETTEVLYISQARTGQPLLKVNEHLTVVEWPNKRPNTMKDFFFICKKLWKEKPGALIVHFGATNLCMIAAWLLRVKYRICWIHTLTGQYHLDNANAQKALREIGLRKKMYRMATHVVVLNKYGKEDAIKGYYIDEKKIVTIANGIFEFKDEAQVVENKIKHIRFIGRFDKSKGLDVLLEAFAILVKENDEVMLDIAGKGPEKPALEQQVIQLGLQNKVLFHGYFSDYMKARAFLLSAYCLVVPSRMDNFPTVILEALSSGVPVIASAAGGITDMIEDGCEGYLVKAGEKNNLAEALKRITADKELRNKMAVQAKKSFEEKFSMNTHVDKVLSFLNSLN